MTEPYDIRDDLEAGAGEDLVALAHRLQDSRPLPHPSFRGNLGRQLAARARPRFGPARVRALVAAYSVAGVVLLGVGTVSAAGLGPLG